MLYFTVHSLPAFLFVHWCPACVSLPLTDISWSLLCGLFILFHISFCQISFPLYPHEVSHFPLCFPQPFINIPSSLPVNERTNQKEVERDVERGGGGQVASRTLVALFFGIRTAGWCRIFVPGNRSPASSKRAPVNLYSAACVQSTCSPVQL